MMIIIEPTTDNNQLIRQFEQLIDEHNTNLFNLLHETDISYLEILKTVCAFNDSSLTIYGKALEYRPVFIYTSNEPPERNRSLWICFKNQNDVMEAYYSDGLFYEENFNTAEPGLHYFPDEVYAWAYKIFPEKPPQLM